MKQQFETIDGKLLVRAPAKINLSLLIAGKRPDGFHEIETIMSKVSLYDDLLFEHSSAPGLSMACKGVYALNPDADNLVYRACMMAMAASGRGDHPPVKVTLNKRIPIGAGLGGGSSDAAAALMGINRFASLGIDDQRIYDLACQLGSDVPFFLGGPLAMCTGRGEKVQNIDKTFDFRALLVLPNVTALTKRVYSLYRHDAKLYESLSKKIGENLSKNRVDLITAMCVNMLECACYDGYDKLGQLKTAIEQLSVPPVCLSGSGSTMYIMETGNDERKIDDYQAMLTESIGCDTIIVDNNRW